MKNQRSAGVSAYIKRAESYTWAITNIMFRQGKPMRRPNLISEMLHGKNSKSSISTPTTQKTS